VPVLSRLWSQAWTLSHICVWAGSCRTAHAACAIPSCAELQARKKLRVLCLAGKFSSPHAGPEEPVTRPEALGSVIAHIRVRDLDAVGFTCISCDSILVAWREARVVRRSNTPCSLSSAGTRCTGTGRACRLTRQSWRRSPPGSSCHSRAPVGTTAALAQLWRCLVGCCARPVHVQGHLSSVCGRCDGDRPHLCLEHAGAPRQISSCVFAPSAHACRGGCAAHGATFCSLSHRMCAGALRRGRRRRGRQAV